MQTALSGTVVTEASEERRAERMSGSLYTAIASAHIIAPTVGRHPLPETEPSIASQPSAMV